MIQNLKGEIEQKEELEKENENLNIQVNNISETMVFLENENKAKNDEIEELNKDIKHLMDVRAEMKKKTFKDEQKIKGLQQVVIKDLKAKLTKKVRFEW